MLIEWLKQAGINLSRVTQQEAAQREYQAQVELFYSIVPQASLEALGFVEGDKVKWDEIHGTRLERSFNDGYDTEIIVSLGYAHVNEYWKVAFKSTRMGIKWDTGWQNALSEIGEDEVVKIYKNYMASCHKEQLNMAVEVAREVSHTLRDPKDPEAGYQKADSLMKDFINADYPDEVKTQFRAALLSYLWDLVGHLSTVEATKEIYDNAFLSSDIPF